MKQIQNTIPAGAGMDLQVQQLYLGRVMGKLMLPNDQEGEGWSLDQCNLAEREYKRFLTLLKKFPSQVLVPNKLMDEIWHRHILDTAAYRQDCAVLFGCFVDHYPYYGLNGAADKANLERDFISTKNLYLLVFGEEMDRECLATRCGTDHACHAESSCACRVSTACKTD